MSFDLYFASKVGMEKADIADFRSWFAGRPHYDQDALEHNQGFYENEDTGVYFIFEFGQFFDKSDPPETSRPIQIVLLLNYLRPRFFALECIWEIEELVDKFDLEVVDPQENEIIFSGFDSDRFINSFTKHNRQAVPLFNKNPDFQVNPVSSDKLESVWEWNFYKPARQEKTKVDVFFPKIYWFLVDAKVLSGIVWGDGIPTVIPPCDAIYLHWDQLAYREVLGFKVGKPKQDSLFERNALKSILSDFYKPADRDGCLWPREHKRPPQLAKALQSFDHVGKKPQMLASDAVLDDIFFNPTEK